MPVLFDNESKGVEISTNVFRKVVHLNDLMTAVIDFTGGPMQEPDPPHAHPHEQISYVAEGELYVYIGEEKTMLGPGDMFYVPSNVSHTVQTLTEKVRLVDSFSPIRQDFLVK
jgi:quercetin dioxygenase-like cupin family protein